MTNRELFQEIMHYGTFDRMPVIHWTQWPETTERWHREGWPEDQNIHELLGTRPHWTGVGVNLNIHPAFEEEVLEETAEYRIVRGGDGVVMQDWKEKSCIPHYIDFTFQSAAEWPEYKKRLQPDPARVPEDLDERIARAEASGLPIVISTASMMGWIRNWMGVENMSYLMYDDPDVYADIVDTLAELACWGIDQVIPRMSTKPDLGFGWEDICGKTGPLVSPAIFREHVAPGYRKMRAKLEEYDVHLLGIDSDGYVEPLAEDWLESGVNVLFPIEPGTWGATPEHFRERFGKELRIIGGYDKLALEKGKGAIKAEVEKHIPLMKEGGFLMMPDHLITPDTPLENYQYYIELIRELRF
jgi:uroporphyrinogen decarboxylase